MLGVLVIKLAWVWTEHWYNGGSSWSCPKGIFVVIDTHWVLCYCLMTHDCVLAGSFASALATGSAWVKLALASSCKFPSLGIA